jgi:hypothetical protein
MKKRCPKCGESKTLNKFYKDKYTKCGFTCYCKECAKNEKHEYYKIHKNKIAKRCKKYQQTHKDKTNEYQRKYQRSEKGRKYKKQYRQTHKAEYAKYLKKYRRTLKGCLHDRFQNMKRRCTDPNFKEYKHYGGRGIQCLFKSSQEFVNYVVNELQADPRGLQIDRINNNGNYEPGNIRFVTAKINNNNKRKRKCQKN